MTRTNHGHNTRSQKRTNVAYDREIHDHGVFHRVRDFECLPQSLSSFARPNYQNNAVGVVLSRIIYHLDSWSRERVSE